MRVFLGVELADNVRAAVTEVAARLCERLQRDARDLHARWVSPENFHITLWFIGDVSDTTHAAIAASLTTPAWSIPSFELSLSGCGAFPPSGQPRVFWIGVQRGAPQMKALYAEVTTRLAPFGYLPEGRPYSPHLTIARVKDVSRGSSRAARSILEELSADCGTSTVAFVTLFRSHLSPRGATYEPLLRVPLS